MNALARGGQLTVVNATEEISSITIEDLKKKGKYWDA